MFGGGGSTLDKNGETLADPSLVDVPTPTNTVKRQMTSHPINESGEFWGRFPNSLILEYSGGGNHPYG